MAADNPAGPPPIIRTSVSIFSISLNCASSVTSGSSGNPSMLLTIMFSLTCVMQDFTGTPFAITAHFAHCPLAQKIP